MDSTGKCKINFNEFLAAALGRMKVLSPDNFNVASNLFNKEHDSHFELKSLFGFRDKGWDKRSEVELKELLKHFVIIIVN